ncbi:MAG: glycosyltransferase family A protein [candidate division FCPU426 bacterium]
MNINPNQTPGKAPVVSVVVPSYNHARYLGRRLDSILEQTLQDFELIILDDASTDESPLVIKKYLPHPKIRFVQNQTNSGSVFKQWAKGFALSQGRYIWMAESDDWADPRLLETLVALLEKHPRAGLAYCQSAIVNQDGAVIGNAVGWTEDFAPGRWQRDFVNSGMDEIRNYLTNRNTIPNASAVLIRKSALEALGPLNTDFQLCGDWMLWVRLLEKNDVAFCSQSLNYWRINTSNARLKTNGTLEWLEGEKILRQAATMLGLGPAETTEMLFAFLKKCWQWQRESLEKRPPASLGWRERLHAGWNKITRRW